ncbi:MAG: nitronate monooxygenase, partial [Elusimicrobia bacterium]|nr:nitronate monooxygenase [Elusimicrobiota bacterium]
MTNCADPIIISGGMGAWISRWTMARIVSMMGGLGIVSGTALDIIYARILQNGDPGGFVRRAFAELSRRYPVLAKPVQHLLSLYFIDGGKPAGGAFRSSPTGQLHRIKNHFSADGSFWEPGVDFQTLNVAANFAEVWLAKEGHSGPIGINYLRKIERPLPWALFGALLADVDYVAVGAGNPAEIPELINKLCAQQDASLPLKVSGAQSADGEFYLRVRPHTLIGSAKPLPRPKTLAIVSSYQLAKELASNPHYRPYGFILEGFTAGGHNAPPSRKAFNKQQEPVIIYTEDDAIDIAAIAKLGLPFWLAGGYGHPQRLKEAMALGAVGIQFGTAGALCAQSGL